MAFQDVLRLNATLTRDPQIREIVRHHRAEDAGHERWFLDDLAAMQIPAPDVRWLFGERHSPTRDAAYALMSEVYRASDDRLRLVLVKTLESAGHVFFGRVAAAVERAGWTKSLKYFSFSHLEVEKNHQVFEDEISRDGVGDAARARRLRSEAKRLVDRCYAAFGTMFDAICARRGPPVPRRFGRRRNGRPSGRRPADAHTEFGRPFASAPRGRSAPGPSERSLGSRAASSVNGLPRPRLRLKTWRRTLDAVGALTVRRRSHAVQSVRTGNRCLWVIFGSNR